MSEQGGEKWLKEKLGVVSASNIDNIVTATGKAASPERRARYLHKLLAEWKMGKPLTEWEYKNATMQAGNDNEESAVALFELETGLRTAKVGFINEEARPYVGCSPDRLVEEQGSDKCLSGLEIKNPLPWTQIGYLLKGKCPTEYVPQVQSSMWITELGSWYFMSNCADLDPLIVEVKRDDEYIEKMEKLVNAFVEEMLEKREKLK